MVLINGVLEKNQLKRNKMAYMDNEKTRMMRDLIERERALKRKIETDNSHQSLRNLDYNHNYRDRNDYIPQSPSSRENDLHLKISVLTSENQKLKTQYSDLIKKTNLLIDAYRRLEAEHKLLKKKKEKRELFSKFLSGLWDGINDLTKKIIVWFNT